MADKSDVEIALAQLVGAILYPSGGSGASAAGYPARVYRGAPGSSQLDTDLAAGEAHITVTEQPGFTRLTGGYLDPDTTTEAVSTLTATVSGNVVTLTGTPGVGQLVGVVVNGSPYGYACIAGDTPATVAAALVALVNGGPSSEVAGNPVSWITSGFTGGILLDYLAASLTDYAGNPITTDGAASSSGAVMTFATTYPVIARTAALGTSQTRHRWQVQGFRISVWASDPQRRDAITSYLDAIMSGTRFLALPDGQGARLEWRNTFSDDVPQKEQLWRRDLYYTVQFATSVTVAAAPVMLPSTTIIGSQQNTTVN